MKSLDLNTLKQALTMTLNPNQMTIQEGEQVLFRSSQLPNYAGSLIMITDDVNNQLPVRQAAVVNLKNFVEKCWKQSKPDQYIAPENEKAIIRGTIIDALIRCVNEKKLRAQYEDIFYKLCAFDHPNEWPDLLHHIIANLQQINSFEVTYGTISCLNRLILNYQFTLDRERKPLEIIVSQTFPLLENIAQKCLENYIDQTGQIMRIILKIFYHAFYLEMPAYLMNFEKLQKWMTYCKMILANQVPEQMTYDTNEIVIREKSYLWANKKQAANIMVRIIQKYCNMKMARSEMKLVQQHIAQTYAPSFMETFYQILLLSDTNYVGPKTCLYAIKYIFYALKLPHTEQMLLPFLDKILFEIALPKMQLTTTDDRIWKEDPEEYVRRQDDENTNYHVKYAAKDLFEAVCKKTDSQGQNYLMHFLQYCQACFTNKIDPQNNKPIDILKREVLLWGIACQSRAILKIENFKNQIENIIESYVLPELTSNIGFLRARACQVLNEFGSIDFQNKNNISQTVTGIYNCILDPELPVKVAAATSFTSILSHEEAKQLIKPGLNSILEIYIKLMEDIDNQGIVTSLSQIVENFETEISPYAEQLIKHLVQIFFKYCTKQTQQDDSDEDNPTELAAASCLDAIERILNAPLPNYSQIEIILIPLLNYAFSEQGSNFVTEALEILNLLLYKTQVSQNLWLYYPILTYSILGLPTSIQGDFRQFGEDVAAMLNHCKNPWGGEYLKNMVGCFRNFIKKGGDLFFTQNDMFGNSLVMLAFQLIDRVQATNKNQADDTDTCSITLLLISMIENHLGRIDHLIIQILNICIRNIQQGQTQRFRVVNFGVIGVLFWYNAQLVLSLLNQLGMTDFIMECFFSLEKFIKHQWDLQRYFLGILALLKLPEQIIPVQLRNNIQNIGKMLIHLTSLSLKLQTNEDSCELEEQAIEEQGYNNTLDKLQKVNGENFETDDDEDDESVDGDDFDNANLYEGPNDNLNEILLFENVLLELQQSNPQMHMQLTGFVSQEDQQLLLENIKNAKLNQQKLTAVQTIQ